MVSVVYSRVNVVYIKYSVHCIVYCYLTECNQKQL